MQCAFATLSSVTVWLYSISPLYFTKARFSKEEEEEEKKIIEHEVRVLIFPTNMSENFLILRILERRMIKNICWSSCIFLSDIKEI